MHGSPRIITSARHGTVRYDTVRYGTAPYTNTRVPPQSSRIIAGPKRAPFCTAAVAVAVGVAVAAAMAAAT
ncbi:hypothetical protein M0804_010907 [Polistes exclamans]|nr:hypothetical protein M0804_010907 [Polistes exclamans]